MNPRMLAGIAWICLALLPGCDDSSGGSAAAGALDQTRWRLAAWSASALDPAGFDITADFADGRIGGRSAVKTISGTRDSCASTMAGRKFAAALPLVQSIATGSLIASARPSAKKPALRSSSCM